MIYTILNDKTAKRKPKTLRYRCFKNFDSNGFCSEIAQDIRFHEVKQSSNVHDAWSLWYSTFIELCDKYAPIKEIRVKDRNNPWVTSDIIKLMYERDHVHKKAVKTGDSLLFEHYKVLRNKVTSCLDNAKKLEDTLKNLKQDYENKFPVKVVAWNHINGSSMLILCRSNFRVHEIGHF